MVIVFVESILSIFVVKFVYNVTLLSFVLYNVCEFGHCVKRVREFHIGRVFCFMLPAYNILKNV